MNNGQSLQYKDVLECKTPLERSLGYTHKVNGFVMVTTDCIAAIGEREERKTTSFFGEDVGQEDRNSPTTETRPATA